jgi:hypothetical protein
VKPARTDAVFRPGFGESGLVTNEYAYRHYSDPARVVSPDWIVTSGSLFSREGAGWTGVPDREPPDARSANATDSAVFRLVSRRQNFGNVRVTFDLLIAPTRLSPGAEGHSYDGVHVWLHYASPRELYSLSVMRWDGTVAIKRKTPGGPSNGGSYRTLTTARSVMPVGRWVPVEVQALTRGAGVQLTIIIDGRVLARQIDSSRYALTRSGAVGLRGDNTQFEFRNFRARSLTP